VGRFLLVTRNPRDDAVTEADYDLIKGLAAQGKAAVLLVDENIKRALEIADYVYVMRTGYGAVRGLTRGFRRRYRGGPSPAAYTRAGTPDHLRS
jgi:ABC-type multidrug transport system ATPase subunit